MLNFGNKEFRNIQEQVLLNAEEIKALKQLQANGVSIAGQVSSVLSLPSNAANGDAYLVGESPYTLHIKIAGEFVNMGTFPAPGPQGIKGSKGDVGATGNRGSVFHVGSNFPTDVSIDDYFLAFDGKIYRYDGTQWIYALSIRGPQGPQGIRGPQGERGIQGPRGARGPQGEAATVVEILDVLESYEELPDPDLVPRNSAFVINGTLYGITGTTTLSWHALSSLVTQAADDIAYDDTFTELEVSNVQDAIDAVVEYVDNKDAYDIIYKQTPKPINPRISVGQQLDAVASTLSEIVMDIDDLQTDKANAADVYTKTEVDDALDGFNTDNVQYKTSPFTLSQKLDGMEVDMLSLESQIDGLAANKANVADVYTKTEVDNKVSSVYRVKGSVATYANLPTENLLVGDVYNIVDSGINYVWTGEEWDDIGGVEALATAANDGLMSQEDYVKLSALPTKVELDAALLEKADKITITNLVANSDLLIPKASPNENQALGLTYVGTTDVSLVNGIAKFTASTNFGRMVRTDIENIDVGETVYYFARIKTSNDNTRFYRGNSFTTVPNTNSFEFISTVITPIISTNINLIGVYDNSLSNFTPIEVDYMGAINISDLVLGGILPSGLTDDQYKTLLDAFIQSRGTFEGELVINTADIVKYLLSLVIAMMAG